jgi:hypothetical protein
MEATFAKKSDWLMETLTVGRSYFFGLLKLLRNEFHPSKRGCKDTNSHACEQIIDSLFTQFAVKE